MSRRHRRPGPVFESHGPFAVECPGCREPIGAVRELVGRVAGCPRCRTAFIVPEPAGAEEGHAGASQGRRRDRRNPDQPSPPVPRETTPSPSIATPTTTPAPQQPRVAPRAPADHALAAPRAATVDEPLVFAEPPLPVSRLGSGTAATPVPPDPAPLAPPTDTATTLAAVAPVSTDGIATPGGDGGGAAAIDGELAFRDPVKTVRSGGTEIELHRLTPEERRSRRARRNLLILLVGAALLVALVVILGTRGR